MQKKTTAAPDRIAARRSFSSAANKERKSPDYKGLAIILIATALVLAISYELITAEPEVAEKRPRTRSDKIDLLSHIKKSEGSPPSSLLSLEVRSAPSQQPVEATEQAQSQAAAKEVVTKATENTNIAEVPKKEEPKEEKGNAPTRHNQQRYYRPFEGEFWSHYPGAKKLLEEYLKKASLKKRNPGGNDLVGSIEYSPMAEMCNQLLGLVASFALAVSTDRYFGMTPGMPDWYGAVFNPNIGEYNWFFRNVPELKGGGTKLLTNRQFSNDQSPQAFPTGTFICNDLKKEYSEPNINMNVNQYFVPLLEQNSNYKEIFDLIGSDVFRPLGRFILRPHIELEKIVDDFVEKNFKGKYVIGIHLRAGGGWPATQDQWHVYWEAAKSAEVKNGESLPVVWFLAADMNAPREEARRLFGDKIVMHESVFGTKDLGVLYRVAMADVLLLAECDDIVTSSWSTYSYVAAGLAGIKPLIVTEPARQQSISEQRGGAMIKWAGLDFWSNKRTIFSRQPTSQPCFHFYFDWRVQDAVCFRKEFIDHEYFGGSRYC